MFGPSIILLTRVRRVWRGDWGTLFAEAEGLGLGELGRSNRSQVKDIKGDVCAKCGMQGHWEKDCPKGRDNEIKFRAEMSSDVAKHGFLGEPGNVEEGACFR